MGVGRSPWPASEVAVLCIFSTRKVIVPLEGRGGFWEMVMGQKGGLAGTCLAEADRWWLALRWRGAVPWAVGISGLDVPVWRRGRPRGGHGLENGEMAADGVGVLARA